MLYKIDLFFRLTGVFLSLVAVVYTAIVMFKTSDHFWHLYGACAILAFCCVATLSSFFNVIREHNNKKEDSKCP